MKNSIVLSLFIWLLISCGSQKSTIGQKNITSEKKNTSEKAFYDAILKKSTFEQVKISSKIDADQLTGSFTPTINATFYIENQKKIWANLSVFSLSMARGIATPKGVKAYEKINRTYIDSDFSYLNNLLKINFLDYQSFQNLLVGKIFVPFTENNFNLTKTPQQYILKSIETEKINLNGKQSEYHTELVFSPLLDLEKVILNENLSKNQLEVIYENWENIEGQRFPKNVKIIIKEEKTKQILIENTKFEFSKMETPYSVPKNYKKRDL